MPGGIGGLLSLNQNGAVYSYLYDGKGNVTALLDGVGNVAQTYQYDPFGKPMNTDTSVNQPMQFSTKPYDEKTGLSYYGYRYYAPALGRWLTRDPIGEKGGINLYGFAGNNAVNNFDPFGLRWVLAGWDRVPLLSLFGYCVCYWAWHEGDCRPLYQDYHNLPHTNGSIIHQGGNIKGGDTCLCKEPGFPGP